MSIYMLITNVKAIQTGPLSSGSQVVQPSGPLDRSSPTQLEQLQVVVTGTGAVSASVQLVGSNDGVNFVNIGAVTTASGTNSGSAGLSTALAWAYYGAYVTAISGTNATVNALLSA